jgi:hypothetical protein
MALAREDWIKDTEWEEWHLTPRAGWVRGTIRDEKGRFEYEIERPPDCLLTVRRLHRVPVDPNVPPAEWSEIRWRAGNTNVIDAAQAKFGVLPHWFPPLSTEAAKAGAGLRTLSLMLLPPRDRPGRKRW